jgi:hypothetical protein
MIWFSDVRRHIRELHARVLSSLFRKSSWIFLFLPSGEIPQGKIADWDWPRYGELLGSFSPQLVDLRWFLEDRKFQ